MEENSVEDLHNPNQITIFDIIKEEEDENNKRQTN